MSKPKKNSDMPKKARSLIEVDRSGCDHVLVLVKGLVEQLDAGVYFGSHLGLQAWVAQAASRGLVVLSAGGEPSVTEKGLEVYDAANLTALPHHGRGCMWDWRVTAPNDPDQRPAAKKP